ncbi:Mitochondrial import inner membrane translocase subunit tim22, partial [Neurospora sp. IMI 360204]
MSFPGMPGTGGALAGGGGAAPGGFDPNDPNIKWMQKAMESCFAKTVMSGGAGFALGGVFGMFMAS